jgi:lipoprotein NlpI
MSHYYFRGCVHQDAEKWREALADYRKSAELSSPQWEFPRLRMWLVRSRLGEREPATQDLKAWLLLRKGPPNDPAARVAAYLTGTLDERTFLNAADTEIGAGTKGRRCQAYYFAGEKRLLDGDRVLARDLFKKAVATEARNWRDYGSAASELSFMEK